MTLCPGTHRGPCKLTGTVSVDGIGIVSGQVQVGKAAPQGCQSINSCTFSVKGALPAGKKTPVSCSWVDGYALQVTLTCGASIA